MQVTKEEKHTVAIVMTLIDEIGKLVDESDVNKTVAVMTAKTNPLAGLNTLLAFESVADKNSDEIANPKYMRAHLSVAIVTIGRFHPKVSKRIDKEYVKIKAGIGDIYTVDCLVRDIAELMLPPKVFEDFAPIMVKMGESNE